MSDKEWAKAHDASKEIKKDFKKVLKGKPNGANARNSAGLNALQQMYGSRESQEKQLKSMRDSVKKYVGNEDDDLKDQLMALTKTLKERVPDDKKVVADNPEDWAFSMAVAMLGDQLLDGSDRKEVLTELGIPSDMVPEKIDLGYKDAITKDTDKKSSLESPKIRRASVLALKEMVRIAHKNPSLRSTLLPVIKAEAALLK